MKILVRVALGIQLLSFSGAIASDAYLIQFFAFGKQQGILQALWVDDVLFYNLGATEAIITVLGTSNGTLRHDVPKSVSLAPKTLTSLFAINPGWGPREEDAGKFWVLHLDVPDSVIIESRNQFQVSRTFGSPVGDPVSLVSMPVFRRLAPAGEQQVILGTDLGDVETRINVGVYNSAAIPATATVEVRRACDLTLADSRVVVIPANTIIQIGPLAEGEDTCGFTGRPTQRWVRYTVVTVDQPSLAYVANVAETAPGQLEPNRVTPLVTIAVAATQRP